MSSNKKRKGGIVFSTNPDFVYSESDIDQKSSSFPKEKERLIVALDKRNRGGKQVTLVKGFQGEDGVLEELGKSLKAKCGSGGSVKEREIIIQGDFRDRVVATLQSMGYNAKRGN